MSFDEILRALLYAVACAILCNALDDAFIDVLYFWRGLGRKIAQPLSVEALRALPQKRIAIVVPAWHEAAVISDMLEHNLSSIDYDNYVIFCGTYQNDPDTQACVERVSTRSSRVRNVIVPHDGPTSKADCLNWVYQGVLLEQERQGVAFEILLMHDAEDVIHPLSLRLYNQLIPDNEFVQTPVFSLDLPASHWVAGTYIDEFSEHHLKDMLVRQSLGGLVPSAGVGSAFDFTAFRAIATAHGDKPFNVHSLTEDYEIGLKFRLAGRKVCFACHTVAVETKASGRRRSSQLEYIATREYFPSGAWASVRQRSRWICGITLQTWQQVGFVGPLVVRYCLLRDRKALWTNTVLLGGYGLLLLMSGASVGSAIADSSWNWQRVIAPQSGLYWLLWMNTFCALWRAGMKAYFVGKLHGPLQAALSVPRLLVGNLIGVLATARAVVQYVKHRLSGEPLRWVKTSHAFPSTSVLKTRHRALGETLLSLGHVNEPDLSDALGWHRAAGLPLGEVLTASGLAHSDAVVAALAERWGMPPAQDLSAADVALSLLQLLAESEAEALDVLPYEHETDHVTVIVAEPLLPRTRALLEARFAARVQPLLATRAALSRTRAYAYRRLQQPEAQARAASQRPSARPAGELLVEAGLLSPQEVEHVLREQRSTGELFGESLMRNLAVAPESLPPEIAIGHAALARIELDQIDVLSVYMLGYAMCALYCCLPLTAAGHEGKTLASPFPLPRNLIERAERVLGCPIRVACAPALQVRAGLSHSLTHMRKALGSATPSGISGIDAEELRVIMAEHVTSLSDAELLRAARHAALSPLELLERRGELDAEAAARLRASALGIEWLPSTAPVGLQLVSSPPGSNAPSTSVLPPSFLEAHRIRVVSDQGSTLCLAAPRPTPALTRMAGRWLPDRAIEWRVAA